MKRLIKQSIMNIEMFKGSLNQLSDEGRDILKLIEDYKFKLDQTCRLTANDQQLTQKLQQKRKQLDVASGQIYSIVFDIDNIDITQAYEQQQINTNPNMPSTPNPAPVTNQPINNVQQPQENNEQTESDDSDEPASSVPSGGSGGVPAPSDSGESSDSQEESGEDNTEPDSEPDEAPESNDEGNEE